MRGIIPGVVLACAALSARAAEKKEAGPPKIEPVSDAEKAKLLAAETPAQKKLRAEIAAFKDHRIVFNANATGRNEVYLVRPDGSEMTQVTKEGGEYPHLSPDGKRIVFLRKEKVAAEEIKKLPFDESEGIIAPVKKSRRAHPKKESFIWIVNADGTGAERVAAGEAPHWSPSGKAIAYQTATRPFYAPAILDLEAKTERVLRLTGLKGKGQCMSAFSPDGKWLLTSNGPIYCWPLNETGTDVAEGGKILKPVRVGHVCNTEFGPQNKYLVWVIDTHKCAGSWLVYSKFDPSANGKVRSQKMKLGWPEKSVNYFPDLSPCGKYMAYVHAEMQDGVKSWLLTNKQEIYISRFPPDGVNVRVTWNGAGNQHPHWWGPAAK